MSKALAVITHKNTQVVGQRSNKLSFTCSVYHSVFVNHGLITDLQCRFDRLFDVSKSRFSMRGSTVINVTLLQLQVHCVIDQTLYKFVHGSLDKITVQHISEHPPSHALESIPASCHFYRQRYTHPTTMTFTP